MENDELLTTKELAERLRLSERTIIRRIHYPPKYAVDDLRLIQKIRVGGQWRFIKSSVDQFIHGHNQD